MLELFCRKPDKITIPEGFHLTDIPTGEEASSLSAILLDDDYYNFTLANTIISEGLYQANDFALIVLKAKAFINNLARKNEGQNVQNEDIEKHWKDIIRLSVTIDPQKKIDIPQFNQRGSQNLYSNCMGRTARRKKNVEKPWRWGELFGRHFCTVSIKFPA